MLYFVYNITKTILRKSLASISFLRKLGLNLPCLPNGTILKANLRWTRKKVELKQCEIFFAYIFFALKARLQVLKFEFDPIKWGYNQG